MLVKTKAIVLHCIKYGESGIIANFYTEQFGRQAFLVHGIRKQKGRIHPYLFEALSLLDINLYYKENRELQVLKDAKPTINLNHIYFEIKRSSIALFLGEVLFRILREEEGNPALFSFLFSSVQILDIIDQGLENFPLIFLIQLSKFIGIHPKNNELLDQYQIEGKIQIEEILDYSLPDIGRLKIPSDNRHHLLVQLLKYYSSHFDGMGQIKSLQILREIYH